MLSSDLIGISIARAFGHQLSFFMAIWLSSALLSLSQARVNSLILSSEISLSNPIIIFHFSTLLYSWLSFFYRDIHNWRQYSSCGFTTAKQREIIASLLHYMMPLLMHPKISLPFFGALLHGKLMANMHSHSLSLCSSTLICYRIRATNLSPEMGWTDFHPSYIPLY